MLTSSFREDSAIEPTNNM